MMAAPLGKLHANFPSNVNSAYMTDLTDTEVKDALTSLSLTRPEGYDGIRARDFLINYNKLKTVIVLYILSEIMPTGKSPCLMKVSLVRPVYKDEDKQQCLNYRPIAILSCLACVLEKVLYKRMIFRNKHHLLSQSQHGFICGSSTTTLLEDFVDNVNTAIDNNKVVLGLFLDLRKVFDTIDINLLIKKLSLMGFRELFCDYFEDRQQIVRINGVNSALLPIKYEVPQGSVLGSLFNLYINDLTQLHLHSSMYQYADHTALILAGTNYDKGVFSMQQDVYKIVTWFNNNFIYLNKRKTHIVSIVFTGKLMCDASFICTVMSAAPINVITHPFLKK